MASIKGIEGMTVDQLNRELDNGAKFVVFQYCISIFIMTFRRGSDVYFVRAGESTFSKSIAFTILSLILGWWGIPWGPIYTLGAVFTNMGGGKDVTAEVLQSMNQSTTQADTSGREA